MTKLSDKRAEMPLDLGQNIQIKVGDAARILKKVSRTTLYRWSKYGIDNHAAKELLKLHATKRIIPNTATWRGFYFNDKQELITPLGDPLYARYLEQFRWFLGAWDTNMHVIKEINENLSDIRDVANTDKGTLIRNYERLKKIYRTKTHKLNERLSVAQLKIKMFEDFLKSQASVPQKPASKLQRLTLVKPSEGR